MADVKAYAINQIRSRSKEGKTLVTNAKEVFDVDEKEFERLEVLGAARKATKDEIAIAKDRTARTNGSTVASQPATTVAPSTEAQTATASGAKGDPKGAPKGSSKSDDLGV
jgi:hypothetical protein